MLLRDRSGCVPVVGTRPRLLRARMKRLVNGPGRPPCPGKH
ncbi:hypothetical protein Y88_1712 [Novosphingobium nitrogenifigens DSM 19370]|uniref:Uncharacterized protein n=1 Tax=Novosphingobium nitrogenifigens DSM 19370 TaxID=983920 RepID=F1Z3L0_9SPHN|nr:hypothetical protein Y88_1712 [Novosphingobium nitrogenifigens DSM 19370]